MLSILMNDQYLLFAWFLAAIFRGGGGIKSLTPFALQDRRLTLPHIAAGSKTFFGNVNKRLIGKTDYVRTSENPATPAFDTR